MNRLDEDYDIICKFDADIVFPKNYVARVTKMFETDPKLGIAGGLPYVNKNGEWVFEKIASKDHVRGPIKAYRKACFQDIGGLRKSVGWDSMDVLLAQYHGWNVKTDKELHVKHLKPTGTTYNSKAKYLQGRALYKMRYGFLLTFISLLKGAVMRRNILFFIYGFIGFLKSLFDRDSFMISEDEGRFFRGRRWKKIGQKLNLFRKRS